MVSSPRVNAPCPTEPPRRICAQPRIAFSGVRSSCEAVARKSSFCSARLFGLGSRVVCDHFRAPSLDDLFAQLPRLLFDFVEKRLNSALLRALVFDVRIRAKPAHDHP
jgi:hypothetical protein